MKTRNKSTDMQMAVGILIILTILISVFLPYR